MVVVDVDDDRGLEQAIVGEPRLLGAVDRDENPLGRRPALAQQTVVGEPEKSVFPGQRRCPGENHDAVLPELEQREVHGEQRAERVAVRILVRGDEEAVVRRASASTTAAMSVVCVIARLFGAGVELVDQLRHPDAVLDRLIVLEEELRGATQMELAG